MKKRKQPITGGIELINQEWIGIFGEKETYTEILETKTIKQAVMKEVI